MAMGMLPENGTDNLGDGVVAEINITPLTDVFLVLLVIFMVTSSALVDAGGQTGIKVNLPSGGAQEIGEVQKTLVVAILEDGRAVIGGKVMDDDSLKTMFDEAHAQGAATTVVIQADKGVPHGRVVAVMEAAKAAGLGQLAIATQPE